MKAFSRVLLTGMAVTSILRASTLIPDCAATCAVNKNIVVPRAQTINNAQQMAGLELLLNNQESGNWQGLYASSLQFHSSFNGDQIADYLFGPAARNGTVTFSGSRLPTRGTTELFADYFGLAPDFKSTVIFNPRIQNLSIDAHIIIDLGRWVANTYCGLYTQLCHTRWSMNGKECIVQPGSLPFARGYMGKNEVTGLSSALTALGGCTAVGDNQGLIFGKIPDATLTRTRIPDFTFVSGWNFFNRDRGHVGVFIQSSLPTGNKPTGEFLFEPIVGNGGHFTLGAGISSHWILFDNGEDKFLGFYTFATLCHWFSADQIRSFDLHNMGPLNRYMLLAEFKKIPQNRTGHLNVIGLNYEYAGQLHPAVNDTTRCCTISVPLEADIVCKLGYHNGQFDLDVGYNFWGKTKEKVSLSNQKIQNSTTAFKGDAYLYGAATTSLGAPSSIIPITTAIANAARTTYPANAIPLSAAQGETATIFSGSNSDSSLNTDNSAPQLNPVIDNQEVATACVPLLPPLNCTTQGVAVISPINGTPNSQMNTSNPPQFLCDVNLDISSATAPSATSHKLFVHTNYTFKSPNGRAIPFVGFGAEIEFAGASSFDSKNCVCHAALSQWGFWFKGGVGF